MKYITVILSALKAVDERYNMFVEYNGRIVEIQNRILELSEIVMEHEDTLDAINRAMARINPSQWDSIKFSYQTQ
jgi:hypothetical protein